MPPTLGPVQADPRRAVPRTDRILAEPRVAALHERLAAPVVRGLVHEAQHRVRAGLLDPEGVVDAVLAAAGTAAGTLRPVLNATGVVVHTNLGRAPLSAAAVEAVTAAAGYTDVEFSLETGRRARRGRGTLAALRAALPEAGDVLVVNNGAAALLLAVTLLAAPGREVVWSRGELVEIGDGFRLPELVASTGATIREIGTTNRTTVADYERALGPRTGCVLKVHPSNFQVQGFGGVPTVRELAGLDATLVVDVGSGLLAPHPLLPDEPTLSGALAEGADLVTASGDKLLGGPQAGIIAGRADLIEALRRHPMARALRVDKLTLAALEATLRGPATPVTAALEADPAELRHRVAELAAQVGGTAEPTAAAVGGGGAPGLALPSWAVAVEQALAAPLRERGVVGRLEGGRLLLDLRCVPAADDARLAAAVQAARAATVG
jgi:L-seryl-tRNA(Ser) seleniumtransferase